jgi:Na+-transporting NADH:ubiquinone oxidoreductase subunit C
MQRESMARSLLVALCLCVVCSVLVSSAAVSLRERQQTNRRRQMQKDVLLVAGLFDEARPVSEQFQAIEMRFVDLATGEFVEEGTVDPRTYDPKRAARDPQQGVAIAPQDDLAGLRRREKIAPVYFVRDAEGNVEQVILPVRGQGLWSTMYGFLSLESDLRTVHGITFYEHGETPGLGGEIDNPRWKARWQGKVVLDEDGTPHVEAVRGQVDETTTDAERKIDGLAGATITTRGVTNMVQYWLGDDAFGTFLDKQRTRLRQDQV